MPNAAVFITKFAICFIATGMHACFAQPFITLASTTSTEQSGLFGHILPAFKKATGIDVRVVALGTGQALDAARRGNADVVMVHDVPAEEKFVAEGFGFERQAVMYNDFILVGHASDPSQTQGKDIAAAFKKMAHSNTPFISRGDKSGTHSAELRYWKAAGLEHKVHKEPEYRSCGCGMGAALNMAFELKAYVLTDRSTWLSYKNRDALKLLVQGDERLFNPYGVIVVNPAKHPHVKLKEAQAFANWLISSEGQRSIASYTINGEQLFFPNAATTK